MLLSLSVIVGSYIGSHKLGKIASKKIIYNVTTTTYNSYTDSTSVVTDEIVTDEIDLAKQKPKDGKVTAVKYETTNSNELREQTTYDLDFLNYDSIDEYIKYYNEKHELSGTTAVVNVNDSNNYIKDNVDYFEIIYQKINSETEKEETSYYWGCFIALVIGFTLIDYLIFDEFLLKKILEIRNKLYELLGNKSALKEKKKEIIEKTNLLLEEIKQNELLRQKFNEEMSKHQDIIDALEYEIIDNNGIKEETKKLALKR